MAAAEDGYSASIALLPQGSDAKGLDQRPVALPKLAADPGVQRGPLFAQVLSRRSNKEPFDLTRPIAPAFVLAQFSVLNHFVRVGDRRTLLAIANTFQVAKTLMTHSLGVLERAGLIVIRKNPTDGRSKLVHITDKGRAFREAAIAVITPDFLRIAAAFPRDHVASLLLDLETLRKVLDKDRDRTA